MLEPRLSAAAAGLIVLCCFSCPLSVAPTEVSTREARRQPFALAHDGPPFEYEQGPIMLNPPSNSSCFNADRMSGNKSNVWQGRFVCPEEGASTELTECCGPHDHEYCCSPWDSVGMKWGIGIGITVAVIILIALGYTVQLFRACDRCYHEFPILGQPVDYHFSMETRWYSVSHEGNRYGVTFHSKRFASHFMQLLESCYGPWNAANILRIRKDDQDFVVLHIFFNDFFTPWFYTQGPIKNDEEWIRSDFKELCYQTQSELAVKFGSCCRRGSKSDAGAYADSLQEEVFELVTVPAKENQQPQPQPPIEEPATKQLLAPQLRLPPGVRRGTAVCGRPSITSDKKDHRPWTKHTFKIGLGQRALSGSARGGGGGGGGGACGGSSRQLIADRDSSLDPPWHRRLPASIEEAGGGTEKATQTLRAAGAIVV